MNPPQWHDLDSIHFRIAAQKVFTGTEAARWAPGGERAPAHDAFTRLLPRPPPDTEALGQEAKAFVDMGKGLLVLDDTTRKGGGIEVDHWGLKQCGEVERGHLRKAVFILRPLLLALQALRIGVSGDEAQAAILREAIRRDRAHPRDADS
jgi:hypothetical protein